MSFKYLIGFLVAIVVSNACLDTTTSMSSVQTQIANAQESSEQFTNILSPSTHCPDDKRERCSDDGAQLVTASDGRCVCMGEKQIASLTAAKDTCSSPSPCDNTPNNEATWAELFIAGTRIGCGCFKTMRGKIVPPLGYHKLLSARSDTCKNNQTLTCDDQELFVIADDGRCGCVSPKAISTDKKRCTMIGCGQYPVSASPALLYRNGSLLGCGLFESIPQELYAYRKRESLPAGGLCNLPTYPIKSKNRS